MIKNKPVTKHDVASSMRGAKHAAAVIRCIVRRASKGAMLSQGWMISPERTRELTEIARTLDRVSEELSFCYMGWKGPDY